MKIEWQKTEFGECDSLEKVPIGATIDAVDDRTCFGRCEGCGKQILDGDEY